MVYCPPSSHQWVSSDLCCYFGAPRGGSGPGKGERILACVAAAEILPHEIHCHRPSNRIGQSVSAAWSLYTRWILRRDFKEE